MVVMVNFHHTGHLQILENNDSEVEMQDAASEGGIFKSHFFPVLYKFIFFQIVFSDLPWQLKK